MERLAHLPGVQVGGDRGQRAAQRGPRPTRRFLPAERAGETGGGVRLGFTSVAGDYFSTMGIRLLAGRAFTEADQLTDLGHVIVNRSAANLLWPGQSPIGRRLKREEIPVWETVVGVVEDVMQDNFRDPAPPAVYYPLVGQPPADWVVSSPAYVVKTPRAETIAPEIRALVREVAPGAPMYRTYTMAGLAADSRLPLAFTMLTLGVISLLAVILGTVGQYGVLSYIVAERTREIGVRMALGAQASRVQRMVVGQGARVLLVGRRSSGSPSRPRPPGRSGVCCSASGRSIRSPSRRSPAGWCWWGCSRRICRRGARRGWIRSSRSGASSGGRSRQPAVQAVGGGLASLSSLGTRGQERRALLFEPADGELRGGLVGSGSIGVVHERASVPAQPRDQALLRDRQQHFSSRAGRPGESFDPAGRGAVHPQPDIRTPLTQRLVGHDGDGRVIPEAIEAQDDRVHPCLAFRAFLAGGPKPGGQPDPV